MNDAKRRWQCQCQLQTLYLQYIAHCKLKLSICVDDAGEMRKFACGMEKASMALVAALWLLLPPTRLCDKTMRCGYTEYNVFHSDDVNGSKQKHSGDIKPYLRRRPHFPSTPSQIQEYACLCTSYSCACLYLYVERALFVIVSAHRTLIDPEARLNTCDSMFILPSHCQ